MNDNRYIEMLAMFAAGLMIGTVATLLYAPASGEASRRRLRRVVRDLGDSALDTAEAVREGTEEAVVRIRREAERVGDVIEKGSKTLAGRAKH